MDLDDAGALRVRADGVAAFSSLLTHPAMLAAEHNSHPHPAPAYTDGQGDLVVLLQQAH